MPSATLKLAELCRDVAPPGVVQVVNSGADVGSAMTLHPGIALTDGRPHLLYGTQGADGQPQTLAVLLSGLVDLGLSPEAALAQPRFLLGRTFSDSRDSLKVEASLDVAAITSLAAMGHETAELPALSPIFGCAGAIRIDATGCSGAHDPRGEGLAL